VLFGATVNESPWGVWRSEETKEAQMEALETALGRRFAISHHYYGWKVSFPTNLERWDLEKGRIPLISWAGNTGFANVDQILAGDYDELIRERARALRDFGSEIFLRWGWEMNGSWSGWGGLSDPYEWPAKYVAAWQRIHDLFLAEGASNVVWVWSPYVRSYPNEPWNHWSNYYPGDAYVDWVAPDGYNRGAHWLEFSRIFGSFYRAWVDRKPIMIAETGSEEVGGDKAQWFAAAQHAMKVSFPQIKAFVYWYVDAGATWHMRANTSPAAFEAFKALALDPYFSPEVGTHTAVVAASPAPWASKVQPDAEISAEARTELDCSTVSAATVTITPAVLAAPTCVGNTVSFENDALALGTTYTVTLGPDVRTPDGQPVPETSWSFRTAPPPPQLQLTSPIVVRRTRRILAPLLVEHARVMRISVFRHGRRLLLVKPNSPHRLRRRIGFRVDSGVRPNFAFYVGRRQLVAGRRYRMVVLLRGAGGRVTYSIRFRA
jgi:hypothetical protein